MRSVSKRDRRGWVERDQNLPPPRDDLFKVMTSCNLHTPRKLSDALSIIKAARSRLDDHRRSSLWDFAALRSLCQSLPFALIVLVPFLRDIIVACTVRPFEPQVFITVPMRLTDELPTVLSDVVEVTGVTRVGISVSGGNDTPSTELLRLLVGQVVSVPLSSQLHLYTISVQLAWSRTP